MKTSTIIRWVLFLFIVLLNSSESKATTCNWKSRNPFFKVWDSCGATGKNQGNIYGYTGFNYSKNTCFKYQWSVNGYNVSSGTTNPRMLQYQPGYNGTYVVRLKVTDTCNSCDTTFTDTVKISCLTNKNTACNWAARNPKFMLWDSCSSKANPGKISGYIYWNYSIYLQGCFKYYWEVNGTAVNPTASLNRWMIYMPKSNGKYNVKLKVVDTCNNCDTTFSDSITISCLTAGMEKMEQAAVSFTIWPNPTDGSFHISGISQGDIPFEIYDIRGGLRKSGLLKNAQQEVEISDLNAGFYFVRIYNGDSGFRTLPIILRK